MAKYLNFGLSLTRGKENSGKSRSSERDKNIKRVRELMERKPHMRAQQNELDLAASSFNRITRKEIRWSPHQIYV